MSNELIFCRVLFFFSRSLPSVFCVVFFLFRCVENMESIQQKREKAQIQMPGIWVRWYFRSLVFADNNRTFNIVLRCFWYEIHLHSQLLRSAYFKSKWMAVTHDTKHPEHRNTNGTHTHEREKKKINSSCSAVQVNTMLPVPIQFSLLDLNGWNTLHIVQKKANFELDVRAEGRLGQIYIHIITEMNSRNKNPSTILSQSHCYSWKSVFGCLLAAIACYLTCFSFFRTMVLLLFAWETSLTRCWLFFSLAWNKEEPRLLPLEMQYP